MKKTQKNCNNCKVWNASLFPQHFLAGDCNLACNCMEITSPPCPYQGSSGNFPLRSRRWMRKWIVSESVYTIREGAPKMAAPFVRLERCFKNGAANYRALVKLERFHFGSNCSKTCFTWILIRLFQILFWQPWMQCRYSGENCWNYDL